MWSRNELSRLRYMYIQYSETVFVFGGLKTKKIIHCFKKYIKYNFHTIKYTHFKCIVQITLINMYTHVTTTTMIKIENISITLKNSLMPFHSIPPPLPSSHYWSAPCHHRLVLPFIQFNINVIIIACAICAWQYIVHYMQ